MKDYAVILKFDRESEENIQKQINLISQAIDTVFPIPPHISIAIFQTNNLDAVEKAISRNLCKFQSGKVTFPSLGVFPPKVLFLTPIVTEVLLHNNKLIYKILSKILKNYNVFPANFSYYFPNHWQPHCTLAIDLDAKKLEIAFSVAKDNFALIEATIDSILIVECEGAYEEKANSTWKLKTKD